MGFSPPDSFDYGISRQEYWSGWPFPSPGDLPDPRIKTQSPALQVDYLPSEPPGNPKYEGTSEVILHLARAKPQKSHSQSQTRVCWGNTSSPIDRGAVWLLLIPGYSAGTMENPAGLHQLIGAITRAFNPTHCHRLDGLILD